VKDERRGCDWWEFQGSRLIAIVGCVNSENEIGVVGRKGRGWGGVESVRGSSGSRYNGKFCLFFVCRTDEVNRVLS
jgi:hypothetical protein